MEIQQNPYLSKYSKIFKYHGGGFKGLLRVWDTFKEIDLFDFKRRGVKTNKIKKSGYSNSQYMFYSPVYSSVSEEMMRTSFNYYTSAVRYTEYDRKTVFIDLGCGAGKTIIQASEIGHFDYFGGVEIDSDLSSICKSNIEKTNLDQNRGFIFEGNVEKNDWTKFLVNKLNDDNINLQKTSLFIFNKNSYGSEVLKNSLEIANEYFSSIFYLYQNPIHHKVLINNKFDCFLKDSATSTSHKNFKYKCYYKN